MADFPTTGLTANITTFTDDSGVEWTWDGNGWDNSGSGGSSSTGLPADADGYLKNTGGVLTWEAISGGGDLAGLFEIGSSVGSYSAGFSYPWGSGITPDAGYYYIHGSSSFTYFSNSGGAVITATGNGTDYTFYWDPVAFELKTFGQLDGLTIVSTLDMTGWNGRMYNASSSYIISEINAL